MQDALTHPFLPELGKPISGKVREIYEADERLTMISSDRISIFDTPLKEGIPGKGGLLNRLSLFWFQNSRDILDNHLISYPDPNVFVVKRCRPIPVEMIVRGYLAGSLARDYAKGSRTKCGVELPEGLKENDKLPRPIVTPTTKAEAGADRDITPEELISEGVVSKEVWEEMSSLSLKLYQRGCDLLKERGIILVDTKYEFGWDAQERLTLIDEIHTPDSSRFWFESDLKRQQIRYPDKELVRQWALERGYRGGGEPPSLPSEVIQKTQIGYRQVYEALTGSALQEEEEPCRQRLLRNLKQKGLIKGVFAQILAGSEKDRPHLEKIEAGLKEEGVPFSTAICSAHKETARLLAILEQTERSIEPTVMITVAGRSNALSGVVACNSKWPVIACPPFKDGSDYLINVHSSLQMPSRAAVMTVIDPKNAALAACRILKAMERV